MDAKTKSAYSENAKVYSDEWLAQPKPSDMYELLEKYFVKGAVTADIGCGSGRDSYWLNQNGFPVHGYDSSEELLKIASSNYGNSIRQSCITGIT